MICPHCHIAFHDNWETTVLGYDGDQKNFILKKSVCPTCTRMILLLEVSSHRGGTRFGLDDTFITYPRHISRIPISTDVPDKYAQDYKEACYVLEGSSKASV